MTSSFKGQVPESSVISQKAIYAHVFKYMHSASVIYLIQVFHDGYTDIIDLRTNSYCER